MKHLISMALSEERLKARELRKQKRQQQEEEAKKRLQQRNKSNKEFEKSIEAKDDVLGMFGLNKQYKINNNYLFDIWQKFFINYYKSIDSLFRDTIINKIETNDINNVLILKINNDKIWTSSEAPIINNEDVNFNINNEKFKKTFTIREIITLRNSLLEDKIRTFISENDISYANAFANIKAILTNDKSNEIKVNKIIDLTNNEIDKNKLDFYYGVNNQNAIAIVKNIVEPLLQEHYASYKEDIINVYNSIINERFNIINEDIDVKFEELKDIINNMSENEFLQKCKFYNNRNYKGTKVQYYPTLIDYELSNKALEKWFTDVINDVNDDLQSEIINVLNDSLPFEVIKSTISLPKIEADHFFTPIESIKNKIISDFNKAIVEKRLEQIHSHNPNVLLANPIKYANLIKNRLLMANNLL